VETAPPPPHTPSISPPATPAPIISATRDLDFSPSEKTDEHPPGRALKGEAGVVSRYDAPAELPRNTNTLDTIAPESATAPESKTPVNNIQPVNPANVGTHLTAPRDAITGAAQTEPQIERPGGRNRVAEVFELKLPEKFYDPDVRSQDVTRRIDGPRPKPAQVPRTSAEPFRVTIPDRPGLTDARLDPRPPDGVTEPVAAVIPRADLREPPPVERVPVERPQSGHPRRWPAQTPELGHQGFHAEATKVEPVPRIVQAAVEAALLGPEQKDPVMVRQPAAAGVPVPPEPRLRINRLDVQIINQSPAPPSHARTGAPDPAQLLERRYLGRADLIV
jgi:hypothetical protein